MVPLQALPPATSGSLIIKVSIHLWQRLATVNKFKAILIEKKHISSFPEGLAIHVFQISACLTGFCMKTYSAMFQSDGHYTRILEDQIRDRKCRFWPLDVVICKHAVPK